MSPGLVIFDCDGVLVDSEPIANRIFTDALRGLGLDVDYAGVSRDFTGLAMDCCLRIVERRLGGAVPSGFLSELERRTFAAFQVELRPVPGIRAVLEHLDLPVCVASSGEPEKLRLTLGLTGLLPRFRGKMFSSKEVPRGKPHPDLFLHAAARMGVAATDCVVVEDSLPGVLGGVAAGMRVLGFAARGQSEQLRVAGATVFDSMHRLPQLLEGKVER